MAISNGAELLSLNTTKHEEFSGDGNWRVCDISSGEAKTVVENTDVQEPLLYHQFTPDNELLMILPQRERSEPSSQGSGRVAMGPTTAFIDEADTDREGAFFHGLEIPSWLAKKMIVVTSCSQKFFELE